MVKVILIIVVLIAFPTLIFLNQNMEGPTTVGNNTNEEEYKNTTQNSSKKVIDLSNQSIVRIPSYVFEQTNIEELNVSNNSLTGAIQAEIRLLVGLRVLNASNNNMTGVPAEIGQLQKLEILDLSNNQITGLPYELGNLKNLKILNLSGNEYSKEDLNITRKSLPQTVEIIVD